MESRKEIEEKYRSNAVKMYNYIKSLPPIKEDERIVLLNKKEACEKLNITLSELEDTFLVLTPGGLIGDTDPWVVKAITDSPTEPLLKWRLNSGDRD